MAPPKPPVRTALVVEPRALRARELQAALARLGVEAETASDAEEGWQRFAAIRPQAVFAALAPVGRGAGWLLRRLRDEFMGQMPAVYLTCAEDELTEHVSLEPDAVLVPPIPIAALAALVGGEPDPGDSRQAARLRELFELSLLGGELSPALDALVARTALAFQVSDCVLWGTPHLTGGPRAAREPASAAEGRALLARCQMAARAGCTLIVSDQSGGAGMVTEGRGRCFLGARLGQGTRADIGTLCLVDEGLRSFGPDARDALQGLARRVASELAWVSAHNRLVTEHEKLRQAALIDPLLGVWTRSALEQTLESEIAAAERRGEELCLSVLDFVELRTVNDRHGHVTGDAVLTHLARTIESQLRGQDMLGRFGGDELAILFVGAGLERASELMERLLRILEETPFCDGGVEIPLQVTVGLTRVLPGEREAEPCFVRALGVMRRARRQQLLIVADDPQEEEGGGEARLIDAAGGGLPAGSTLGGMYRILHELSRGAMGVVYRGEDLALGRPIAIKVLRPDLASDQDLVLRFRSEASLLASLHHNNLVQVHSFGQEGDAVFFVMELVEGEALSDVIMRIRGDDAHIGFDAAAQVVEEIADALDAIHSLGIIHRDVKPANVLLDRIHDRAVLVDVGVAKRREEVQEAAGTPGFAAPESFMNAEEGPSTDVYGLAATAYAMLTGLGPFGTGELHEVIDRQLYDGPTAPSHIRPELPRAADEVLFRALAPEPGQRYKSASAFSIALARALGQRPAAGEAEESAPTAPSGRAPLTRDLGSGELNK